MLDTVAAQFLVGKVGDSTDSSTNTVDAIENKVEQDTPDVVEHEQEDDDADATYFGGASSRRS